MTSASTIFSGAIRLQRRPPLCSRADIVRPTSQPGLGASTPRGVTQHWRQNTFAPQRANLSSPELNARRLAPHRSRGLPTHLEWLLIANTAADLVTGIVIIVAVRGVVNSASVWARTDGAPSLFAGSRRHGRLRTSNMTWRRCVPLMVDIRQTGGSREYPWIAIRPHTRRCLSRASLRISRLDRDGTSAAAGK